MYYSSSIHFLFIPLGGMLLQKLDSQDLQCETMSPFEGTTAYAQNKRQQVVITDHWSTQYPRIHFSTMHPGTCSIYFISSRGHFVFDLNFFE